MSPTIISFVSPVYLAPSFSFLSPFSLFSFPPTLFFYAFNQHVTLVNPSRHSIRHYILLLSESEYPNQQAKVQCHSTSWRRVKDTVSVNFYWRPDIYNIHSGYAFVYLVRAQPSNQLYALKKIQCPPGDQEAVSEAMREVDMYRMFQHENIISVLVCCPLLLSHFVVLFTA